MSTPSICLILLCAVLCQGCVNAPPRAKDGHDVVILADGPSRQVRTNTGIPMGNIYGFSRGEFQIYTGGKLYPIPESDAVRILQAAHALYGSIPSLPSPAGYSHLWADVDQAPKIAEVAKASGVRYLVFVHDAYVEKYDRGLHQRGRIKLVGGLGFSYQTSDQFYRYRAGLVYSVWDCAKVRFLFRTTTEAEVSGAGGVIRMRGLWPKLGIALTQAVNPSSTSVSINTRIGDYALDVRESEWVRYWAKGNVQSGTLGIDNQMHVVGLRRIGETVEVDVIYRNDWKERMIYEVGPGGQEVTCMDINRVVYRSSRSESGFSGTLSEGQTARWTFRFVIADRNVDFVTLQVPLRAEVGEFWFDQAVAFRNVPLF